MTLQIHTSRLGELIKRYSVLELESAHGETRKKKRRARKHLGLLRCQIAHDAEQEQAIFVRLSELHVEAQSRELWGLARQCHSHARAMCYATVNDTASNNAHRITTLNGASPEFVPRRDGQTHGDDASETGSTANGDQEQVKEDKGQICRDDLLRNHGLKYNFARARKEDHGRPKTFSMSGNGYQDLSRSPDRRYSLPTLQSSWPM